MLELLVQELLLTFQIDVDESLKIVARGGILKLLQLIIIDITYIGIVMDSTASWVHGWLLRLDRALDIHQAWRLTPEIQLAVVGRERCHGGDG